MEYGLEILRDPVSSASHFITAFASLIVTLFLFRITQGDPVRRLCLMTFGCCSTVLYSASGLYHALNLPVEKLRVFQQIDMSAIYLMIAGSATPIIALLMRGRFRLVLLIGEWMFALVGILVLWICSKPVHPVMVGLYMGMGWLATAGIWHYWKATGWRGLAWVMGGAGFYSLGAVIELSNWPVLWPGVIHSHELLHISDILGTACHLVFIVKYVLPFRHPSAISDDAQVFQVA
jgi:hemolysin III